MITIDDTITALTKIAMGLETDVADHSLSNSLIEVRNRSRAAATLSTVQAVLADDWLIQRLTLKLRALDKVEPQSETIFDQYDHDCIPGN